MDYPSHVAVGTDESVLMRIREPNINLAIFERPAPPGVQEFLVGKEWSDLCTTGAFPGRVHIWDSDDYLKAHWSTPADEYQENPGSNPLVADIRRWLPFFKRNAGHCTPEFGFRVTARELNPAFHKDQAALRLIVIYQGAGMRWLKNTDAVSARDIRQFGGKYYPRPGTHIYRLPTYAVAFIKGELWQASRSVALVHRAVVVRQSVRRQNRPRVLFVASSDSRAL